MDPVEQFFASDICHMLGFDYEATVHCRRGDLGFSTPAGSMSMENSGVFHSPKNAVPNLQQSVWLKDDLGSSFARLPAGDGTDNCGVSSHARADNDSGVLCEDGALDPTSFKTRKLNQAKAKPINRISSSAEPVLSSSNSWPYCISPDHTSPISHALNTDFHLRLRRRHTPGDLSKLREKPPL